MKFFPILFSFFLSVIFCSPSFAGHHAKDASFEDIKFIKVNDYLTVMQAGGGNIAIMEGERGLFVIDSGLVEKQGLIKKAIAQFSDKPVRYLVNTHWHYDHTGNNILFGDNHATIIAHDNVRSRLKNGGTISAFDKVIEPADEISLPAITYDQGVTLHINNEAVRVHKIDNAHTDGDSVIFWPEANVIHTGDLFFNGMFPFVDSSSGGTLKGMINAINKILSMIDDKTKIIPGHGPLATKVDLERFNAMLQIVDKRLDKTKKIGQSKKQWLKNNLLKDLEEEWANGIFDLKTFTNFIWDAP